MHKKGYTFPGEELETCLSDGTTGCLPARVCHVKNGHSSLIFLPAHHTAYLSESIARGPRNKSVPIFFIYEQKYIQRGKMTFLK